MASAKQAQSAEITPDDVVPNCGHALYVFALP